MSHKPKKFRFEPWMIINILFHCCYLTSQRTVEGVNYCWGDNFPQVQYPSLLFWCNKLLLHLINLQIHGCIIWTLRSKTPFDQAPFCFVFIVSLKLFFYDEELSFPFPAVSLSCNKAQIFIPLFFPPPHFSQHALYSSQREQCREREREVVTAKRRGAFFYCRWVITLNVNTVCLKAQLHQTLVCGEDGFLVCACLTSEHYD